MAFYAAHWYSSVVRLGWSASRIRGMLMPKYLHLIQNFLYGFKRKIIIKKIFIVKYKVIEMGMWSSGGVISLSVTSHTLGVCDLESFCPVCILVQWLLQVLTLTLWTVAPTTVLRKRRKPSLVMVGKCSNLSRKRQQPQWQAKAQVNGTKC